MAKKSIGKVRGKSGQTMVKVIYAQKSPQTGAYTFPKKHMSMEDAKAFLAQRAA